MDFDLCKENIQPLRGGRNPRQLEMALQAQTNESVQRQLLQQKQEHENAIQNYEGDDPLENWFWYIVWIEQSYPKHGVEGNFANVLEECLFKFEKDSRYFNDVRFCKLWIRYIDLKPNPTEFYHVLYACNICRGCAELYRAWAFYYEARGDFRNADIIFNLGKKELAQPMADLESAHQAMIYAAGQQVISGIDSKRLLEERHALTTLATHKGGRVDSIRVAASSGPGLLPSSLPSTSHKSNFSIPIYEGESIRGAEAVPESIIAWARRQTPKENVMKPGAWSAAGLNLKPSQSHHAPKFKASQKRKSISRKIDDDTNSESRSLKKVKTMAAPSVRKLTLLIKGQQVFSKLVHEDSFESSPQQGLKLPPDFSPVTFEDHTTWRPLLCYPEPDDPTKIPMYPKSRVYTNSEVEFSIEELRACRYIKRSSRLNVTDCETVQAIQSILGDSGSKLKMHQISQGGGDFYHNNLPSSSHNNLYQQHQNYPEGNPNLFQQEQQRVMYNLDQLDSNKQEEACANVYPTQIPHSSLQYSTNLHVENPVLLEQRPEHYLNVSQGYHQAFLTSHEPDINYQPVFQQVVPLPEIQKSPPRVFGQHMSDLSSYNTTLSNPSRPVDYNETNSEFRNLWRSNTNEDSFSEVSQEPIRPRVPNFAIYEESNIEQKHIPSKGSAMKSMPFRVLSDEELAETGSRGGHDIAAAAQPGDGAKRNAIFEDDSSSSFLEKGPIADSFLLSNLNSTCTTQAFNFNLNAMQVSTPQPKLKEKPSSPEKEDRGESSKKQLFSTNPAEKAAMPTILEETHRSSSSSSSAALKSNLFSQSKKETLPSINEDNNYHFNLTQNLKANAALRTSALLELMDYESAQQSTAVANVTVTPLEDPPSDPFKPAVLKSLMDRVGFPSSHSTGYIYLNATPRVSVRKEVQMVGDDKYIVDKSLGKGTYGQVFKAFDLRNNRTVALKVQKPAHPWEFYICRELQSRLSNHPLKDHFMDIYTGYFSDQISLFTSEFSPSGSLLELVNLHKQRNSHPLNQVMVIYFCIEMLKIISTLHQIKIIHGDIKPDNFLVYILSDGVLQLQLIDFGASIDMSLFPPGTSFTRRITTKDFVCCEMMDGRSWNYHTDLFCIAATAHVLLFNSYLQMQKRDGGEWFITQRFTRYMRTDLWNTFFNTLLNQQSGPADPETLIVFLKEALHSFGDKLNEEMRKLINILNNQ